MLVAIINLRLCALNVSKTSFIDGNFICMNGDGVRSVFIVLQSQVWILPREENDLPASERIWQVQSLTACCAGYVDHIPFACGLLSRIIVNIVKFLIA